MKTRAQQKGPRQMKGAPARLCPYVKPSEGNGGSHTHKQLYSEKHLWVHYQRYSDTCPVLTCSPHKDTEDVADKSLVPRPLLSKLLPATWCPLEMHSQGQEHSQDTSGGCQNTSVKTECPETLTPGKKMVHATLLP